MFIAAKNLNRLKMKEKTFIVRNRIQSKSHRSGLISLTCFTHNIMLIDIPFRSHFYNPHLP